MKSAARCARSFMYDASVAENTSWRCAVDASEAAAVQTILDKQLFPFLDELLHGCMKEISQIRFDKRDPQQLFSMVLYGRIIELSYAIAKLIEAGMSAGI